MKIWKKCAAAAALAALAASGAQAASVVCGDATLGLRVTTVDPAASCTYAGLTNLGDGALETLMDTLLDPTTDATIINRDTANSNGGDLNITGVGALSGGWSFAASAWANWNRVFLYFHFGDAGDDPGPTSTTDPDIFIVELSPVDNTGTWLFSGKNGLSNIALIGADANGNGGGANGNGNGGGGGANGNGNGVPEPATLALVGLGLLGAAAARRRQRA